MYELKKIGKVFTSKSVGTGPSSYENKNLPGRGLTKVQKHCCKGMKNRQAALVVFMHVFTKEHRRKGSFYTSAIFYDATRSFVPKPLFLVSAAMPAPNSHGVTL